MEQGFNVVFQPDGKRGKFQANTNLLEAARSLGIDLNSVCGGVGACGKCVVRLVSGQVPSPSENERRFIDGESLSRGFRLACMITIGDELVVAVPSASRTGTQRLQTEGLETDVLLSPLVSKRLVEGVTEILYEGKVIRHIESKDSQILGFAIDVGSTKLAGYLIDLSNGKTLSVATAMNPQVPYGEDIISRIASAIRSERNNTVLHEMLIEGVRKLLEEACIEADQSIEDVYDIVLVGNTAMQHFILGINPRPISKNPFKPENIKARSLPPETLNLNSYAHVFIPPLIAGFVGADCVAATLATGVDRANKMSFLMDIGTNTEILVGKHDHMVACSCASGPAFEGAHIKYGMRAASGAIEGVWINGETLEPKIKVIGDTYPRGLCGSGLIDLLSEMLKTGIIDSSGRFRDFVHSRLRKKDGVKEYVVAWSSEAGLSEDISVTQKDVRELQKGKAAIFSGSYIVMTHLDLEPRKVEKVFIAGAFGTYINRESAQNIGMIPEFNLMNIEQVGNAAGTGARMALLSKEKRIEAEKIPEKVEYIELSTHPGYNQAYIDALMLPHRDLTLFPETVKRLETGNWIKADRLHKY